MPPTTGSDFYIVDFVPSDGVAFGGLFDGPVEVQETAPLGGEGLALRKRDLRRADIALEMAASLFERSGLNRGEVLLVTDSAGSRVAAKARELMDRGILTSVLAAGTSEGAPIPSGGGFVSDTWEYDGTSWTQVNPLVSPSMRCIKEPTIRVKVRMKLRKTMILRALARKVATPSRTRCTTRRCRSCSKHAKRPSPAYSAD